ncbi:MAG: hypothetical protein CMK56_08170 [Proteobacteria bacterium]|nr:hypothetical protein [Pseudomonadota bacterium]|tara:strand:- start:657 stop:1139 length:483 start_codon:yes stop_codon:yes gene_type:complete
MASTQKKKKIDDGVYRVATRLLTRREFTRKKIKETLLSKGFATPDVDNVIDELEISGLLSEKRYVDGYIRSRRSRYGHLKILYSLRQLGVIKSELSRARKILMKDEIDFAHTVWDRKFGNEAVNAVDIGKQIRFLLGRGFAEDLARKIVFKKKSNFQNEK